MYSNFLAGFGSRVNTRPAILARSSPNPAGWLALGGPSVVAAPRRRVRNDRSPK